MNKPKIVWLVPFIIIVSFLSGCNVGNTADTSKITASGMIAANSIEIAPEVAGVVVETYAEEGDIVSKGDPLFRLDDELLNAQYEQAKAAVEAAKATVEAAEAQVRNANAQYELVLLEAYNGETLQRQAQWQTSPLDQIDLPSWYFQRQEQLNALEKEVHLAEEDLQQERDNLDSVLKNLNNQDFIEAETRLAEAQSRFEIAAQTLEQAKNAQQNETLEAAAQDVYDAALAALEAAQKEYERLLNTTSAQDVLEARARVAVAQSRLQNARQQYNGVLVGEESPGVRAAEAAVFSAEKAVEQARANLAQAEAALQTLEIQLSKATVRAPSDGVVLNSDIAVGELVSPGRVVMTMADLTNLQLTVYVSETQYGQIELGQEVSITTDSFSGERFNGRVVHIADEAEFTPRNVQTVDGRKTTVYAIKIAVPNLDSKLKPGMPVDVEF